MASVSVIIPLYNKGLHIERALRSVLAQSFQDFEVVVVDDGSTDNSATVVSGIRDSRIRLIRQENAGVSAARNRGIEESFSSLVAFLDADDEWLPNFLAETCAMAERYPDVGVVFSNMRKSDPSEPWLHGGLDGCLDSYFDFFVSNGGKAMSSSTTLAKREILLRVGGFPPCVTHGEDLDTWARLAWVAPVGYVSKILAVYHTDSVGRATDASHRHIAAGFRFCLESCLSRLRHDQVPPRLRQSTMEYAEMLALLVARELKDSGDGRGAIRAVIDAFPPVISPRGISLYVMALARSVCPVWALSAYRMAGVSRKCGR